MAWRPVLPVVGAYRGRNASFPTLYRAGEAWGQAFVSLRRAELLPAAGGALPRADRIVFQPATYPAFILRELVRDWTDYDQLVVELSLDERERPGDRIAGEHRHRVVDKAGDVDVRTVGAHRHGSGAPEPDAATLPDATPRR